MKMKYLFGLVLGMFSTCYGQQTVRELDWQKLAVSGELLGGNPVTVDGKSALKIVNTNETGLQLQLLRITNPPISKMLYAITGEIKYEGVKGDGFIEMWNCFPPDKRGMFENKYFSRTLGESGDMGKITGTSNWRTFMLPFDRTSSKTKPTRLEINVVLPAQGTVYIGPIKLVEFKGDLGLQKQEGAAGAWWSDRAAGWIGGIGGTILGCLGSILAVLAARGRCRAFVIWMSAALIAMGIAASIVGVAAVVIGQPYAVWFPLVLLGVLLLCILPFRLRQYQKGYADLEMRRMASMDA
jgi:hypothetical protein